MRTSRQISVTLPHAIVDAVRARVPSGHYASESEVIREGLRALTEQERGVETWLHGAVAAAYDAVMDGSAELMTPKEVRASLTGAGGAFLSGIGLAGLSDIDLDTDMPKDPPHATRLD